MACGTYPSALAIAVGQDNAAAVAMLLQHQSAQPGAANGDGWTLLHRACLCRNPLVVREFLKHPGTQINAVDVLGDTAFFLACCRGDVGVLQELLQHPGLDLGGVVAAMAAAAGRGHSAVVALLKGNRAVRRASAGSIQGAWAGP